MRPGLPTYKSKTHGTGASDLVTLDRTGPALSGLTSESERVLVFSAWYGRALGWRGRSLLRKPKTMIALMKCKRPAHWKLYCIIGEILEVPAIHSYQGKASAAEPPLDSLLRR